MSDEGFPTDPETLDLLDASIRNEGGGRSNLFGALDFLSTGSLDGHQHGEKCVQTSSNSWDCTESGQTYYTPQGVILALIGEVRRTRAVVDEQLRGRQWAARLVGSLPLDVRAAFDAEMERLDR